GLLPMRTVVTLAVSYQVAILLLPLLLSRDVFSYSYYGRIVSRYGGNPYVQTPANFPQDPLWQFTWPEWRTASSVYGPTFVWLVVDGRDLTATGALTLGALVKVTAAIPLALLIAYLVARSEPGRRIGLLAKHVGVAAGISLVTALPFLQLHNPTLGMLDLVHH